MVVGYEATILDSYTGNLEITHTEKKWLVYPIRLPYRPKESTAGDFGRSAGGTLGIPECPVGWNKMKPFEGKNVLRVRQGLNQRCPGFVSKGSKDFQLFKSEGGSPLEESILFSKSARRDHIFGFDIAIMQTVLKYNLPPITTVCKCSFHIRHFSAIFYFSHNDQWF